ASGASVRHRDADGGARAEDGPAAQGPGGGTVREAADRRRPGQVSVRDTPEALGYGSQDGPDPRWGWRGADAGFSPPAIRPQLGGRGGVFDALAPGSAPGRRRLRPGDPSRHDLDALVAQSSIDWKRAQFDPQVRDSRP